MLELVEAVLEVAGGWVSFWPFGIELTNPSPEANSMKRDWRKGEEGRKGRGKEEE